MAEEQIIVDIKVNASEILAAEKAINNLTTSIDSLGKETSKLRAENKSNADTQKDLNKLRVDGKITLEEYKNASAKLTEITTQNNKKISENNIELSKQKNERNANIKLINSESNSRDQLRQKIALLNKEYSHINQSTKEGRARTIELQKELHHLNTELNKGSLAAGNFKDNIGNYGSAFKNLGGQILGAIGLTSGIALLTSVFSNSFKKIKEFGKGISELEAITGASGKDLDFLKNKAKDLAAEYGKSATDIVNAMKLVGSAKPELLKNVDALGKVTEAVLTLSQASGMDLATATSSLTTIMNQFGHDSSKANEDINILAAGSKFGAVEVDYLAQAISKVGTIANSAGISLQQTTAVMELFGEKGVKAETAGTGFKSILVALQKDTKNYTNGVFDLNKAIDNNKGISNDNIALQKKFGAEFFGLAQILFQGKDRFNELTQQVTNTNTAFKQAKIATNNLSGDLDRASGTWDKFVLGLEDGGGGISNAFRGMVKGFSGFLSSLTTINDAQATSEEKSKSWIDILSKANPVLMLITSKLKDAENGILSLIPGMDRSIQGFKDLFGIVDKGKEVPGIFDTDKLKEQARLLQEQVIQAKNGSDATIEGIKELTAEEIAANEKLKALNTKKREDKEKANQELLAQIKQMNIDLLDDENEKAIASVKLWREKEKAKIEASIASKQIINDALEAMEYTYSEKLQEINDKREKAELDKQERLRQLNEDFKEKQLEDKEEMLETTAEDDEYQLEREESMYQYKLDMEEAFQEAKKALILASEDALGAEILTRYNMLQDEKLNKIREDAKIQEDILKQQLDDGLITETEYQAKIEQLNKDTKNKEAAIVRKQALFTILIDTAVGIVKALSSSVFPLNLINAAIVAGMGALQYALTATRPVPTFAKGTSDIVGIGGSHASGNDVDVWGYSGNQKQYFGKVERGEAMPVIRKSAVNDYMIAKLNGKYDSRQRKYANGSLDITGQTSGINQEIFMANLTSAINNIQIVAKIEDITKQASRKMEIVDNSKV